MPAIPVIPIIRAMSEAAPRIRIVTMKTPQTAINRMFGSGQIILTAKRLDISLGDMNLVRAFVAEEPEVTAVAIGRAVIAFLLKGELGAHTSRSDNEKDCILGVVDAAELEGNVLSMYVAIAREQH